MLSPKSPAPAFSLPSTSGRSVSTKDLRGRRYVLYFYPKDDTPGCTKEACDFRDNLARLGKAGIAVYGVSKDTVASHLKFQAKYGLTFELLSDEGNALAKLCGAFGEKTMYGKPVMGVIRSTFLVDADGKVERVWSPVKVEGHVDAVLSAIAEGAIPSVPKRAPAAKSGATIVPPRAPAAKLPAGARAASSRPSASTPGAKARPAKAPVAKSSKKKSSKKTPARKPGSKGA
ncbi:MAG: redoxin domain-containing protein [Planctomycetota bacterium]|nr:redoxin domain-containing protein [Planctomycetota bacterium]